MLYLQYLIIMNGPYTKKKQFQKFPFLSRRGWKTA